MVQFDMMKAITDTLVVMNQRRRHILLWALLQLAVMVGLVVLSLPALIAVLSQPENAFAVLSAQMTVQGGYNLAELITALMLLPAITAVASTLMGIERGKTWLGLRIDRIEGRYLLVIVAVFGGMYGIILVGFLIGAMIVVPVYFLSQTAAIVTGVILFLALIIGSYWLMARTILIAPATLALGKLSFVEGWQATKGRVWRLVGTYVLAALASLFGLAVLMLIAGALFLVCGAVWMMGGQQPDFIPFWIISGICGIAFIYAYSVFRVCGTLLVTVPAFSVWQQISTPRESDAAHVQVSDVPAS